VHRTGNSGQRTDSNHVGFEVVVVMSADSVEVVADKSKGRSRITNGAVLPDVDGRSTWVRRLKDLMTLHIVDLGGDDAISEAERSIVRRAAVLTTELERMEVRFATAGEATAAELGVYVTTANALRRLLETVGLERRSRDVTPLVDAYLANVAKREAPKPATVAPKPATIDGAPA
jgi:hypothetical protein